MRKTLLAFTIFFVIFFQSVCYSDDVSDNYETMGHVNGRAWVTFETNHKLVFIRGLYDGASLFNELLKGKEECSPTVRSDTFNKRISIPKATRYEIIKQIDSFYADSSNMRIPIMIAYEIGGLKIRGESPRMIEEYTAELRKIFNK